MQFKICVWNIGLPVKAYLIKCLSMSGVISMQRWFNLSDPGSRVIGRSLRMNVVNLCLQGKHQRSSGGTGQQRKGSMCAELCYLYRVKFYSQNKIKMGSVYFLIHKSFISAHYSKKKKNLKKNKRPFYVRCDFWCLCI